MKQDTQPEMSIEEQTEIRLYLSTYLPNYTDTCTFQTFPRNDIHLRTIRSR